MATRIFCDKCKEEIKGDNVGKLNHQTEWNEYVVSVEAEDEFGNKPDLCLDCLLEIVTAKPKRKYERKQKGRPVGEISGVPAFVVEDKDLNETVHFKKEAIALGNYGDETPQTHYLAKPVANEELIIQTATEETPTYGVNILGRMGVAHTLKDAVLNALSRESAWENQIPKSLSKKNTQMLKDILEVE